MKRNILRLLWVAAAVLALFVAMRGCKGLSVGDMAPQFETISIDGEGVSIGKTEPTLVHFFALWCGPCKFEFPALAKFASKMEHKIKVIAVSEDHPDDIAALKKFAQSLNTAELISIALDREGAIADQYHSYALPDTFLVGADGRILWRNTGVTDWDSQSVLSQIEKLAQAKY